MPLSPLRVNRNSDSYEPAWCPVSDSSDETEFLRPVVTAAAVAAVLAARPDLIAVTDLSDADVTIPAPALKGVLEMKRMWVAIAVASILASGLTGAAAADPPAPTRARRQPARPTDTRCSGRTAPGVG